MPRRALLALALVLVLPAAAAMAQVDPLSGIDFVTVGRPNNAPYTGPQLGFPQPQVTGRGSVGYDYRIGREELSTSQWLEFVNTFAGQNTLPTNMFGVASFWRAVPIWGAGPDPDYHGPGRQYITSGSAAIRPLFGISWRDAALYCNWLHNGKSSDPASLLSGAYDTSTWNSSVTSPFTDALTHEPGARYWIPTLDEWIKAAYYDPNWNGPGQEGWWNYLNSSDQPPVPGLPGVPGATTSATLLQGPGTLDVYGIRLGSYPDALSPWGLLDTASGAIEFTEGPRFSSVTGELVERYTAGSGSGDPSVLYSSIQRMATLQPDDRFFASVRIATVVPSPGPGVLGGVATLTLARRPRR